MRTARIPFLRNAGEATPPTLFIELEGATIENDFGAWDKGGE